VDEQDQPTDLAPPQPERSSTKGLVFALLALLVIAGGGAAVVFGRAPEQLEPAEELPVAAKEPAPAPEVPKEPKPPERANAEPVAIDAGALLAETGAVPDAGGAPTTIAAVGPADAGAPLVQTRAVPDAGGAPTIAAAGSADAAAPLEETRAVPDAGGAPTIAAAGPADAGALAARPVKAPKQPKQPAPAPPVEAPRPRPEPVAAAPVKAIPGGGQVRFKTPGGVADVYVDGAKVGVTPLILQLAAGKHSFEFKVDGYEFGGPKSINIGPGSDLNIEVDLR
jgi:hypothetical protein